MKKISREVKIGIAFIIAIFILYYGISFLKGIDKFKASNSFIVAFDNVEGLSKASPVTLNGFQVGLVFSMQLDKDKPDKVLVNLNMDKGMEIPKGSKFILNVSMLGNASIDLKLNPYTKELYTSKEIIEGERKKGLMNVAEEVVPQITDLVPKIDSLLIGLQALVNNPALKETLNNVDDITRNLAQSTKQLNGLLNKDVPKITGNINSITEDLASTTGKLKELDIKSTFESLDATAKNLEQVSNKVTEKDNSLGLLLNDRQLYDSINSTIGNASALLKDVKDNPSRYINVKVF